MSYQSLTISFSCPWRYFNVTQPYKLQYYHRKMVLNFRTAYTMATVSTRIDAPQIFRKTVTSCSISCLMLWQKFTRLYPACMFPAGMKSSYRYSIELPNSCILEINYRKMCKKNGFIVYNFLHKEYWKMWNTKMFLVHNLCSSAGHAFI